MTIAILSIFHLAFNLVPIEPTYVGHNSDYRSCLNSPWQFPGGQEAFLQYCKSDIACGDKNTPMHVYVSFESMKKEM